MWFIYVWIFFFREGSFLSLNRVNTGFPWKSLIFSKNTVSRAPTFTRKWTSLLVFFKIFSNILKNYFDLQGNTSNTYLATNLLSTTSGGFYSFPHGLTFNNWIMGFIITLGSKCKNFRILRLRENYAVLLKNNEITCISFFKKRHWNEQKLNICSKNVAVRKHLKVVVSWSLFVVKI